MYSIDRADGQVMVRRNGKLVYKAPQESWIAYRVTLQAEQVMVSQLRDLKDNELILALVTAVEIKEQP